MLIVIALIAAFTLIGIIIWSISKQKVRYDKYLSLKKKCGELDQRREQQEETLRSLQEKTACAQVDLARFTEAISKEQQRIKDIETYGHKMHELSKENRAKEFEKLEAELQQQLQHIKAQCEQEAFDFRASLNDEMLLAQKEFAEEFKTSTAAKLNTAKQLVEQINELRSTVASAIEIAKHDYNNKSIADAHRLQLDDNAVADIIKLKGIMPDLHQPEALGKIIWKVYCEKAYTDLIGRLFNSSAPVVGIYRIVNLENQMCYVGQSKNIQERWKQHIKRGVGAESMTNNKLYPAMFKIGIEKFCFEVIEVCAIEKLNEREDYWQEFYKAREFGYSVK